MLTQIPSSVPKMEHLDLPTLMEIMEMAAGMSKAEILNTYSMDMEKFSKDEIIYFNEFFNYGKGMAVKEVVSNLLECTKGKNGVPASMAFLRRFAKEWEVELEADKSGSFSFSFGSQS